MLKKFMIYISLYLSASLCASAAEVEKDKIIKNADYYNALFAKKITDNEDIVAEITGMGEKDQFVRSIFIPSVRELGSFPDEQRKFLKTSSQTFRKIDEENITRLKEILKEYSWTQLADMGMNVVHDASTIIHHSGSLELKIETLKKVKPLIISKKIKGFRFAHMSDRIAGRQNKKQLYGTQFECKDGKRIPSPMIDPINIDKRRKEIGLKQTMAEYTKQTIQAYGPNCTNK